MGVVLDTGLYTSAPHPQGLTWKNVARTDVSKNTAPPTSELLLSVRFDCTTRARGNATTVKVLQQVTTSVCM